MKTFKQFIAELKIAKLYTIAPDDLKPGEDLKSMTTIYGRKKGRQEFVNKWGGIFKGSERHKRSNIYKASQEHPKQVHFYPSNDLARPGGRLPQPLPDSGLALYDVRPGRHMAKVEIDKLEFDHPVVKGHVPGRYIRNKWDPVTKTWKRFK